jgi:hypothetical protein
MHQIIYGKSVYILAGSDIVHKRILPGRVEVKYILSTATLHTRG